MRQTQAIKNSSIRRRYYFGFLLLAGILVLSLAIPFVFSQMDDYLDKIELVTSTVMDQKRQNIYTIINEKISHMDDIRNNTIDEFNVNMGIISRTFASILTILFKDQQHLVSRLSGKPFLLDEFPHVEIVVFDKRDNAVLITSVDESERSGFDPLQDYKYSFRTDLFSSLEVLSFIPEERLEVVIRERMMDNIRSTKLPDNGYVWINHILDFSGGDDYAIRLVHPNLPDTEGMLLSTSMEDIRGNKPFLLELEGINEEGEVFIEYYFKKLNSDIVSRKLSYAKLYGDYNWVIATGIHLDDIDRIIEEEKRGLIMEIRRDISIISSVSLLLIIIFILFLVRFEKQLDRLISWQTKTLEEQNRELSRAAFLDPLTNLWNRRAMYNRFEEEVSRSKRSEKSLCIILTDIDFFKTVNDTYGHDAGDYVLKEVAKLLMKNTRGEDAVSRWGGEEFLILLNNMSLKKGTEIAEKLRRSIEERQFLFEGNSIGITMTFGVSLFPLGGDVHTALRESDERLYQGKHSGRNKVVGEE